MYKIAKYNGSDKMCDLICKNYQMLFVINRFNISLGFGDKSIDEVCCNNNIDVNTFLTIVNLLIDDEKPVFDVNKKLSIDSIISYLRNSHKFFVDFKFPSIRRKLIESMDYSQNNDVSIVIIRFYDEYISEVKKHMEYEESKVFPYIKSINGDVHNENYNISIFQHQHSNVDNKLSELKDIIIKYYPTSSSDELNSVLFDIFTCAEDLASHNNIEDNILVPIVMEMERLNMLKYEK